VVDIYRTMSRRLLLAIPLALLLLLTVVLDRLVVGAARVLAERMDIEGHRVAFDHIRVSPWRGELTMEGLHIAPTEALVAADSTALFHIRAGSIKLRGVDIWRLLRCKVLHATALRMHEPVVEHSFNTKAVRLVLADTTVAEAIPSTGLSLLRIDTLAVIGARASSTDRATARPAMDMERLDMFMRNAAIVPQAKGPMAFRREETHLRIAGLRSAVEPFYTLSIDSIQLRSTDTKAMVYGAAFVPTVDASTYHRAVDEQVELYRMRADSVVLIGFDLVAQVNAGMLRTRALHLHGLAADIHRDKSIPEGPFRHLPLPSEALQGVPIPLAIDSVVAHRSTVRYHERLERGAPYGSVSFTAIEGLLTGLNNLRPGDGHVLHLKGNARFADRGRLTLDMRLPMTANAHSLQVEATVKGLPFDMLNRMTDKLVHVRANSGTIHQVVMRMTGDDRRGSGSVDIHYEDLHVEIAHELDRTRLLTLAANTVVKKRNMPDDRRYRVGRFSVERSRNKGVFNFIWLGLREGMMDVMLPPAVMERVQKKRDRKA
jgi:hypothetical protein